jgi:DNA-binding NarL/FixJ family response regulator
MMAASLRGIDAARRIAAENSRMRLVIVSDDSGGEELMEAVLAGASRLSRPRCQARGGVGSRQLTDHRPRAGVLQLPADDASTAEIAHRLRISAVTVRRHSSSIQRKLRVAGRAGLAAVVRPPRD